jgi:hypothetical protein
LTRPAIRQPTRTIPSAPNHCLTMAGEPSNTSPERLTIAVVLAAAFAVMVIKQTYIGDARWWNLVMAVLLLGVLGVYLRINRR